MIIKDGDVHVMKGFGMPKDRQGLEFGDLYVQYEVIVPQAKAISTLTMEERRQLGLLLDKLEGVRSSEAAELEEKEGSADVTILQLKNGVASDFGTASGQPDLPSPDDGVDVQQDSSSPFSSSGPSQFFFSSSSTSSNPFFGMPRPPGTFNEEEDMDGNMQCQQM